MSAKGRKARSAGDEHGAQHATRADDDYATPEWCTEVILERMADVGILPTPLRHAKLNVLEPTAGAGAIVRVVGRVLAASDVRSVELDEERAKLCSRQARMTRNPATVCGDFLSLADSWSGDWWPDLVIGNPPFTLAQEVAERSIELVRPTRGVVALLLRLNFLGSGKRAEWLRDNIPDVNVLPRRPSFVQVERFHLTWRKGRNVLTVPREQQGTPVRDDKDRPIVVETMAEALSLLKDYHPATRETIRVKRVVTSTDATEYAWLVWGERRPGMVWVLDVDRAQDREVATDESNTEEHAQ